MAWTGGAWFDGDLFRVMDVYTVGDQLTLRRPDEVSATQDLTGRFVVPPFGEAHNHNLPGAPTEEAVSRYLDEGVFYVMIQGNTPGARPELADIVNRDRSVDAVFANGLFTAPGGHPSALVTRNLEAGIMEPADLDGGFLLPVAAESDIDRLWQQSVERQAPDFIKVVLVYTEDRQRGLPRPTDGDRHGLTPKLVSAIVERAHAAGLRVSAHVESAIDFQVAIEAGVDIVAHMPGFWPDPNRLTRNGAGIYRIDEASARAAGARGVAVITTLGEGLRNIAEDPSLAPYREELLDVYRHNIGVLRENGAQIAIGSDQFGGSSIEEALELERSGLLRGASLLRALTLDTVAVVFPNRVVGPVEGARADFIVLSQNPLDTFSGITSIERRVKGGQILELSVTGGPGT